MSLRFSLPADVKREDGDDDNNNDSNIYNNNNNNNSQWWWCLRGALLTLFYDYFKAILSLFSKVISSSVQFYPYFVNIFGLFYFQLVSFMLF